VLYDGSLQMMTDTVAAMEMRNAPIALTPPGAPRPPAPDTTAPRRDARGRPCRCRRDPRACARPAARGDSYITAASRGGEARAQFGALDIENIQTRGRTVGGLGGPGGAGRGGSPPGTERKETGLHRVQHVIYSESSRSDAGTSISPGGHCS
jgi:hypothetical protein